MILSDQMVRCAGAHGARAAEGIQWCADDGFRAWTGWDGVRMVRRFDCSRAIPEAGFGGLRRDVARG